MQMKLLLATHNSHKTREFRELLGKEFPIDDLNSLPKIKVAEETGATFVENATLKAVSVSKHQNSFTIADDSGLEVDALGGAPGIYSARYAGEKASDQENVTKLLRELKAATSRSARFCCIIALARAGKLLGTFEGTVEGVIVDHPRGTNGFGYDPVFEPNGFEQTFAEMASGLKNEISHRAKAIAALREGLRKIED
jgi:XTP/dITP diphosphohydrolase